MATCTSLMELQFNFGDLLMLFACIAYAAYTVSLRWNPAVHWQSFIAATACGALVSSLPLLWWEVGSGEAIVPDATGWLIVLYAAIFPSLMSQVLWVRGVEMIGPNRAGLFINAIPVFGTLLSVVAHRRDLPALPSRGADARARRHRDRRMGPAEAGLTGRKRPSGAAVALSETCFVEAKLIFDPRYPGRPFRALDWRQTKGDQK